MKVNDLVTHKTKPALGIGCISKVLKHKIAVNWEIDSNMKVETNKLLLVDTSKCTTIPFQLFKERTFANSWISGNNTVIIGNEVKQYVGIGWVSLRVVTLQDLKDFPRIVTG